MCGCTPFNDFLQKKCVKFVRLQPIYRDACSQSSLRTPQCRGSSRLVSSLRPHHIRPNNITLAASARTDRLQSGCYGISCIAWSCPTIAQSASSCRWPAQPSPAPFFSFHHSACQLSVVVLFPSPRPYSGTHCRWMSSLPLHFRSSASVWRHCSSTNHFLMLYDRQTTLSWT